MAIIAITFAVATAVEDQARGEKVALSKIDGAIGPSTASFIARCVDDAREQNAECLVIQLNTPGGLLDSTQKIVQTFLRSTVPIVVYVAPGGASATSAGCFITLAADIAAMAPATTIGAAHPVMLGGAPGGDQPKPDDKMTQKLENFSVSYIETIAARRNRNVAWAKSAVFESASITSEKALEIKVIDMLASDLPDLLRKIDGRQVAGHTLRTANAKVAEIEMSPSERLLQTLWRPEVMFVLMLVAIYGIIGELSNPGAILPGVAGAIALILALYMAAVLPVNVTGLVLIGLAFLLFLVDVFAPTHGVLTFGGILSFLIGSLLLFNRADPLYRLSLAYIIPATILTAAFFLFVVGKGLRAQALPVRAGSETLLGRQVAALTPVDASGGKVFVEGEYWNAVSDTSLQPGQEAVIVGREGLTLKLKPKGD